MNVRTNVRDIQKLMKKYPNRIPIIINFSKNFCKDNLKLCGESLEKTYSEGMKVLAEKDITVAQFTSYLRSKLKLDKQKAIFLLIKDTMPPASAMLSIIYNEFASEDLVLNFYCNTEDTFG